MKKKEEEDGVFHHCLQTFLLNAVFHLLFKDKCYGLNVTLCSPGFDSIRCSSLMGPNVFLHEASVHWLLIASGKHFFGLNLVGFFPFLGSVAAVLLIRVK